MNLKIVLVIAICFTISFTFLYLVNDWYNSNFDVDKIRLKWYSEISEIPHKGFLLGNSRVFVLDELLISDHLLKNGKNIIVYDLAIGGKTPDYWKDHLEDIIISKPEIVVIGIDPEDFISKISPSEIDSFWFLSVNSLLSNSNKLIGEKLQSLNVFKFDLNNFNNPKLSSLKIIQFLETGIIDNNFKKIPTQPFFSGGDKLYRIIDSDELRKRGIQNPTNIIENSKQEKALIEIIQNLKENDINIILVITPRPQAFIENWELDEKKAWHDLLIRLERQTDVKIYNLQNQFSELNIFADIYHITRLPEGNVYSEEIAKIILLELNT